MSSRWEEYELKPLLREGRSRLLVLESRWCVAGERDAAVKGTETEFEMGCGLKSSVNAADAAGDSNGSRASRIESLRSRSAESSTGKGGGYGPNEIPFRSGTGGHPYSENVFIFSHAQHNPIHR